MKLEFLCALILTEKNIKISSLRKEAERLRASLRFFGVTESEIESQVGWVDSLTKDFKKSPLKSFIFIFLKTEAFEGQTNPGLSKRVVREIYKYNKSHIKASPEKSHALYYQALHIIQRIDLDTFLGREHIKTSNSMSKFKERKDRETKSKLPF
ncbi:hypothetical protein ACLVWU_06745 [Bdellovibrio sp. HCB290]|uniref:hypothetical protein n=1 Tax=Bdellovibrio sp. HCB290 TaxID=3394356 RepID=UPI0039B6E5C2